jgi:hypothetical protein
VSTPKFGHGDRALRSDFVRSTRASTSTVVIRPRPLAAQAHALGAVELKAEDVPTCGLAEPAEHDPEHRVRVGGGADGRAGVRAHALLVDDDRGAQPVQRVDVRAAPGSA